MVTRGEIEERVKKVVVQVLKAEMAEIKLDSNFVADLGAESVDSISLVSAFEKEFDIEMDEEGALEIQTVGKAVEFVGKILS